MTLEEYGRHLGMSDDEIARVAVGPGEQQQK
jgi:hypothetical protein